MATGLQPDPPPRVRFRMAGVILPQTRLGKKFRGLFLRLEDHSSCTWVTPGADSIAAIMSPDSA